MKAMRLFLLSALVFGALFTTNAYGMKTRSKAKKTDPASGVTSEIKVSKKRHEHPVDPTDPVVIEGEQPAKKQKVDHPAADAKEAKVVAEADSVHNDGKEAKKPNLSIFDLSALNNQLAHIEWNGGILQLELWIHKVLKNQDNAQVYETRKLIILHHVINGQPNQIGHIALVVYHATSQQQAFTEIFWPSLNNIALESLLFLAALYEGYQDNKSEVAKILLRINNISEIRTLLWKGFGFCRTTCPNCHRAVPYDLKKLESYECRCKDRMMHCCYLLHDFSTVELSQILATRGLAHLDQICKSLRKS